MCPSLHGLRVLNRKRFECSSLSRLMLPWTKKVYDSVFCPLSRNAAEESALCSDSRNSLSAGSAYIDMPATLLLAFAKARVDLNHNVSGTMLIFHVFHAKTTTLPAISALPSMHFDCQGSLLVRKQRH